MYPRAHAHTTRLLHRQHDPDTHVFSLLHELAVDDDLVGADAVALCVCWVCGLRNLHLPPLTVCGHKLSLLGEPLELLVDALFLDTAFPLDEG